MSTNQIKEFIKSNPYPTFEEMEIKLTRRFDLDAEYGIANHNQCKTIYENLNDDNIISEMVQKIKRAGGITALNANLIILQEYSPLADCTNKIVLQRWLQIYTQYFYK
jgi:hypothetical protein